MVKYVREGAEHILEGFDHRYKMSQPLTTPRTSLAPPILAPPVKSEMSEVLNAFAMMGQNLQKVMTASQSNSHPGHQGYAHQPAGFSSSQRMDQPCPGAAGNSCFNEMAHFLNYCPVLLEYIRLRKASRNTQNNMVMLGNGVPILLTQKIVHGLLGSMSIMPGTHIYFLERLSKQTFQPTCLNFVVKEP